MPRPRISEEPSRTLQVSVPESTYDRFYRLSEGFETKGQCMTHIVGNASAMHAPIRRQREVAIARVTDEARKLLSGTIGDEIRDRLVTAIVSELERIRYLQYDTDTDTE